MINPKEGLIVYDRVSNSTTDSSAFQYTDGQWRRLVLSPSRADLNMGNNRITNLADALNSDEALNKGQFDAEINLRPLKSAVLNIGGWDMPNQSTITLNLPIASNLIRSIDVLIFNNNGETIRNLDYTDQASEENGYWETFSNSTKIRLSRVNNGLFTSVGNYGGTGVNRGWVCIWYQ